MHPAHRLSAKATIAGQDQALGLDVSESAANQVRNLFRALDLQCAVADRAESYFLVLRDHRPIMLDVDAAVGSTFNRDDINIELIEVGQGIPIRLFTVAHSLCGWAAPAGVAPHFALVA